MSSNLQDLLDQNAALDREEAKLQAELARLESAPDADAVGDEVLALMVELAMVAFKRLGMSDRIESAMAIEKRASATGSAAPNPSVGAQALARRRSRSGAQVRVSLPESNLSRLNAMATRIGIDRNQLVLLALHQSMNASQKLDIDGHQLT